MGWLNRIFPGRSTKSAATSVNTTTNIADAIAWLQAGGETSTGISVTPKRAMQCAAVYACIQVLSSSVAQLPFPLYRRSDGKKEKAVWHPVYKLLNRRPNTWQTPFEFREMVTAHAVFRGNGYAYISRSSSGEILALTPLSPDSVTPHQADDFTVTYKYRPRGKVERVLQACDILHIRGMSLDGFTGVSPISYAREAIGLALASEKYGGKFFGRDATPPFVFSHPASGQGSMSDDAVKNFKKSWADAHAGLDNAHIPGVLREGMTVEHLGISPSDSQFLETRQFQAVDIARIFRVQPHKIGILDRATFSNIEQQSMDFVTDTLSPWLVRWEQAVDCSLLTDSESERFYARHQVQALLRGDSQSRSDFYTKMVQNGAMSPNEVRKKEEMNPRADGDIYLTPVNMTTMPLGSSPAIPATKKEL